MLSDSNLIIMLILINIIITVMQFNVLRTMIKTSKPTQV